MQGEHLEQLLRPTISVTSDHIDMNEDRRTFMNHTIPNVFDKCFVLDQRFNGQKVVWIGRAEHARKLVCENSCDREGDCKGGRMVGCYVTAGTFT
jgi:hypothetical protein